MDVQEIKRKLYPELNKIAKQHLTILLAFFLGVLTLIIIVAQSLMFNGTTTKLEITLFNTLQLLFSLSFAWTLSTISSKNEFYESQRKFAISAYRRIIEINEGIDRLLLRINTRMNNDSSIETRHELEVIDAIATSIRSSIKSSIADWSDIIGDEIKNMEAIDRLESKIDTGDERAKSKDQYITEIDKLISELPPSLQVIKQDVLKSSEIEMWKASNQLLIEKRKNGYITLRGVWDDTFDKKITDCNIGDRLYTYIGDSKSRIGALLVKDNHDNSVGVIRNISSKFKDVDLTYDESVRVIEDYTRCSKFEVELLHIEKYRTGGINFSVKIIEKNTDEGVHP